MTVAIKKQLDESLRDAQLAYYLNRVAPTKKPKLKTPHDLYEYWLLDVLVSQDVPTTPVACAIASLQQYINRILMNMEPGYDSTTISTDLIQAWRNEMHQYPTWAAHQKLLYFPSTYLDPSLRGNKSDNFQQLENDLNQNRIQPDAVQASVLAYLTRFEEVANLNILNGYIDGEDFANSTYYFVAKSRSENTFFWRSLNMGQRPPKADQPDPYAWSDWEKVEAPISDHAIEHTIRPVWFNNRLFFVWAECVHQEPAAHSNKNQKTHPLFRLNLSYRRHDGSWSPARTCLQGYCDNVILEDKDLSAIKSMMGSVAIHYQQGDQDRLFIALYVNHQDAESNQRFIFIKTAEIEKNLTQSAGASIDSDETEVDQSHPHYILIKDLRLSLKKNSLQLKISDQVKRDARKTLEKTSKTVDLKDINNAQPYRSTTPTVDIHYDSTTTKITLRFRLFDKPHIGVTAEGASIQYVVLRPETTVSPKETRSISSDTTSLPVEYTFRFHTQEFSQSGEIFYYGYCITEKNNEKQYFLVATKLRLANDFRTPTFGHTDTAQFLDFSGSKISRSEDGVSNRPPIRLNTVFAAELIRRTENSLDELFSRDTQQLPEPKISDTVPEQAMDFHGPYGRYFTELFLYLPWLIAHRLNTEHQYDEAERWIRYAFDPGRKQADYWIAVPLTGPDVASYSNQAPHDPDQIALSHPVHFRKALYYLYLDILISRGDAAYRELTPGSLGEAKLWYVRVLDLLGPRPVVQQASQWSAISLQTLSGTTSESLRAFEQAIASSALRTQEGHPQASLPAVDTPHLRLPFNPELLKRWDIAESRLYNLRHNLDIAGKPLHLPLFAPPLAPRAPLRANTLGASGAAVANLLDIEIPHYRFSAMYSQAMSAVESVSQFGATLLSLIERKEQAQLQELQQQQAWDLAKISVDLQHQALRIDHQNREALLASKTIAQGRLGHYQQLLEKDVSQPEQQAAQLYLSSGASEVEASLYQAVAGGLMMAPNILGFSNGGMRWEGPMHIASAIAQASAATDRNAALHLDRTAQFNRRREEWTLNRDQAQLELAHIDAQLAHFATQETATRLQLHLAETTLGQTKAIYDFLRKRFTKVQLYQWLNSQFAALYDQAYDATLGLCLAAEACWQYERADFTTCFVQPGAWNTTYRGLGAGEQLKLTLLKMQAEYLQRNERELEVRKTVSLRQLKRKDETSTINKEWMDIHASLKAGSCDFEFTHAMFEDDYQGERHYLRRIKTISVSLPAIVGPYENIRATLTQTSSEVFLSADGNNPVKSLRASQQIALSTGVDDNGLFTLNFNDERYLPFELTGAISKWRLTFPNHTAQKAMLESLTDIIVHVSYTARVGGGAQ